MNLDMTFSPITRSGQPVDELAGFLRLFGLDTNQSVRALAEQTMQMWVNKGHERWQEPETVLPSHVQQGTFWHWIRKLSMYHELHPSRMGYTHLLILGGTLLPQDRKNAWAVALYRRGVRFNTIAHLLGDRKLDRQLDDIQLYGRRHTGGLPVAEGWRGIVGFHPTTEAEMARELWRRSHVPPTMRSLPTQFVEATATTGFRANTGDTYAKWLATKPARGSVLVISINPHAPFQYWDAVRILRPAGFEVDIAAPTAAVGPQRMSYFTGAVARWLRSYVRATNAN